MGASTMTREVEVEVEAVWDFDEELVKLYPKLLSFARGLTKNHAAAEDLLHSGLEKALKSKEQFQAGSNLGAWTRFIIRNQFFSDKRRTWRIVEMGDGQAERIPMWPNQLWKMELEEVLQALEYLPPEMREAFDLIVLEEKSYEEAADIIGMRIGTIKSRVSRARNILESYFGDRTEKGRHYGD